MARVTPAHAAGDRVLETAVGVAREILADRLLAAFAIGSLAHGGFAPLVSDVDLAVVLDHVDSGTPAAIASVRERTIARSSSELADRLSVFWSDPRGVREGPGEHDRLPAIDRLDLLDDGVMLVGSGARTPARRPTGADLVREGAAFACTTFDDAYLSRLVRPEVLVREGPRPVTKAVLFPIRFLYTLLRDHLPGLNAEFFRHYATEMTAAGSPDLAATLREREQALVALRR